MPLFSPNLDDRWFQDFVDDVKWFVQCRIPVWTDYNVHDPGVMLIEVVATIVDQLGYRLNQVPERYYRKFLDLLGITLRLSMAVRIDLTFRLSASRPDIVRVLGGTWVATCRLFGEESISFTMLADLDIVSVILNEVRAVPAVGDQGLSELRDLAFALVDGESMLCFSLVPRLGDKLYIGLSEPAPNCVLLLRTDSIIEGLGVDLEDLSLCWDVHMVFGWVQCEVESDGIGGLNWSGDIVLYLLVGHFIALINGIRAGWVRVMVTEPHHGRFVYSRSPVLFCVTAVCVGGMVLAIYVDRIIEDVLGEAEGSFGQRFALFRCLVLLIDQVLVLEVFGVDGWREWMVVSNFVISDCDDLHFILDRVAGVLELGLVVWLVDGTLRCYGAIPDEGAMLRVCEYWIGGGALGNVAANVVIVLWTFIPCVKFVMNRRPVVGGRDGENVEQAKVRVVNVLRIGDRVVIVEDYVVLVEEAAGGVAWVHCVPFVDFMAFVHVLVVLDVAGYGLGRLPFHAFVPEQGLLRSISDALDWRRLVGIRVVVEPSCYQGVTIVVDMRACRNWDVDQFCDDVFVVLYEWLHLWCGGSDYIGWAFGWSVIFGDVHAALAGLADLDYVENAWLFFVDPMFLMRGEVIQYIDIGFDQLSFSYDHQVRVRS